MIPFLQRDWRPCVGLMIINHDGLIFAGKRIHRSENGWQMPQGGIDDGETAWQAAIRELTEETGLTKHHVQLADEYPDWLHYDLPKPLANRMWQGQYRGQKQKWFLLNFTGENTDVNINVENPEFCEWCWMDSQQLLSLVVPFKQSLYAQIFAHFLPQISTKKIKNNY